VIASPTSEFVPSGLLTHGGSVRAPRARVSVAAPPGPVGRGSPNELLGTAVEVVVLRHQLKVLQHHAGRPRLRRRDRCSWPRSAESCPGACGRRSWSAPRRSFAGTGSSCGRSGPSVGSRREEDRRSPARFETGFVLRHAFFAQTHEQSMFRDASIKEGGPASASARSLPTSIARRMEESPGGGQGFLHSPVEADGLGEAQRTCS
jgi:hypothetical protein